jgi:hypothetical protein
MCFSFWTIYGRQIQSRLITKGSCFDRVTARSAYVPVTRHARVRNKLPVDSAVKLRARLCDRLNGQLTCFEHKNACFYPNLENACFCPNFETSQTCEWLRSFVHNRHFYFPLKVDMLYHSPSFFPVLGLKWTQNNCELQLHHWKGGREDVKSRGSARRQRV